jgi:predicted amidohydrolase YtcJ
LNLEPTTVGWTQVAVHAIGDAAVDAALDAAEVRGVRHQDQLKG